MPVDKLRAEVVRALAAMGVEGADVVLERPRNPDHGDWATNAALAVGGTAFVASFIIFSAVKAAMGVRVDAEEEIEGLDIGEHGTEAYPDFSPAHKS